jgi:hypothetical protein
MIILSGYMLPPCKEGNPSQADTWGYIGRTTQIQLTWAKWLPILWKARQQAWSCFCW